MLIDIDIKALEVVTAAVLSQDKILCQEIRDDIDIHEVNRLTFGLPDRLIAKTFKFRILYGGTEWGFAKDPDFQGVSTKKSFWAKVIEDYYEKYSGIRIWHNKLIQEAVSTGQIISPTGRHFSYARRVNKIGELEWPIQAIKNYIVQGTGADLVMIGRITIRNRLIAAGLKAKLIMTVHDSIVVDCPKEEVDIVAKICLSAIQDIPKNFEIIYKIPFDLKLTAKIVYGLNLKEIAAWN